MPTIENKNLAACIPLALHAAGWSPELFPHASRACAQVAAENLCRQFPELTFACVEWHVVETIYAFRGHRKSAWFDSTAAGVAL